ncbi:anti-sigma-I factor RsgI family protein [Clostridium grantii]|uniref:Anti-sigma factor RsgI-like middle domain-containing protein n=1 Tax=Clostridium grantii DSM 8605 TaxID=1121316 RepID=A0A1M5XJB9_9CLOT|nr:hypothetical protein [Clostridium grantii]SHH99604.1 hypothetical protein SAMN02745207_03683 [Clostridium grantii DSM 8605]
MDDRSKVILLHEKRLQMQQEKINKKKNLGLMPIAIALLIILATIGSIYFYFKPSSTIILDIPPRIQLKVNKFNRVVSFEPLRADGKELADNLDLNNSILEDALKEIILSCEKETLISEDYYSFQKAINLFISSDKNNLINVDNFKEFMFSKKLKLIINQNGYDYK